MSSSRISDALAESGALPASGHILILRPGRDSDLSALPRDRSLIVTGFCPDADHFARLGRRVAAAPDGRFSAALVVLPRAKALVRALIAIASDAVEPGGPIWIDGQKHDGIDAALKDLRARAEVTQLLTKAHGRSFAIANPGADVFADWQARPHQAAPGFVTRPGVFSADGIDPGSALLALHLPKGLKGKGADLGAGWGWLSAQVLAQEGVKELHLVEAEADALVCARDNIHDGRAQFHWADATSFSAGKALDFVVMNPPFHQGRAADPDLGAAFIRSAARLLQPQGQVWLVANRTLPYEDVLTSAFAEVRAVAHAQGFKVLAAFKPRKPGR